MPGVAPPARVALVSLALALLVSACVRKPLPPAQPYRTTPAAATAGQAAPVPDQDTPAPAATPENGPRFAPTLIDRRPEGTAAHGYTPGSAGPLQPERTLGGNKLGNVLAPGLQLLVPLQ